MRAGIDSLISGLTAIHPEAPRVLLALIGFFLTYFGSRLLIRITSKRLETIAVQTSARWDDFAVIALQQTRSFFVSAISLYIAIQALNLSPRVEAFAFKAVVITAIYQVWIWGNTAAAFFFMKQLKMSDKIQVETQSATRGFLLLFFRIGFAALLALTALDTIGINVTTFITGLGVGGIAIALAVQNVLGDLFASLSIIFDRPFEVGDSIAVDDHSGTVEKIGLKTTHLRSANGEQIVFSNTDLLKSRIRNLKRMKERRVVIKLGVTYEMSAEKLRSIPKIVESIIKSTDNTRFERCHFARYLDSSLEFEAVYWILNSEYSAFIRAQECVNLSIFEAFQNNDIAFAYPTQMVFQKSLA